MGVIAATSPRTSVHRRLLAGLETERFLGYLLLLPAVLYIALLIGYPFALALWIALTNQTVGNASTARFVGLDNFGWALESSIFQTALKNTILLTVGTEIAKMV